MKILNLCILLTCISAIALIIFVLSMKSVGFDFSDEGMYFNWYVYPWQFTSSATQFGFMYSYLATIFGSDLISLRNISRYIDLALSFAIFVAIIKETNEKPLQELTWREFAIALALTTVALTSLHTWLPTPHYNNLNLQGMLILLLGLLTISGRSTTAWLTGILVGVGGWLCFLARPSTAVLLAPLVTLYLVIATPQWWRALIAAVSTSVFLAVATALLIDGSLTEFVTRYRTEWYLMSILTNLYTLESFFQNSGLAWSPTERQFFWVVAGTLASIIWITLRTRTVIPLLLTTLIAACIVGFVLGNAALSNFEWSKFQATWVGAVALGGAGGCVLSRLGTLRSSLVGREVVLIVLLVILPFVYAFGTGSNLWYIATYASIFWIVACIILLNNLCTRDEFLRVASITSAAVVGTIALLIGIGVEHPYRQATPLRLQQTEVAMGPGGLNRFKLDEISAKYIMTLRAAAARHGMQPGSPLIDLTGTHPGTIFALDARAPGVPWLLSGYSGSTPFAIAGLELASCATLARSWVLTSPADPINLPVTVLEAFGFKLQTDYQEVARVNPPTGYGEQFLLKPVSPQTLFERCESARGQRNSPH